MTVYNPNCYYNNTLLTWKQCCMLQINCSIGFPELSVILRLSGCNTSFNFHTVATMCSCLWFQVILTGIVADWKKRTWSYWWMLKYIYDSSLMWKTEEKVLFFFLNAIHVWESIQKTRVTNGEEKWLEGIEWYLSAIRQTFPACKLYLILNNLEYLFLCKDVSGWEKETLSLWD